MLIDDAARHPASGEKITLGTGQQTVLASAGDTVVGGNAGAAASSQLIDLTGNDPRTSRGPSTVIGGVGGLSILASSNDLITATATVSETQVTLFVGDTVNGSGGPMTVVGGFGRGVSFSDGSVINQGLGPVTVDQGVRLNINAGAAAGTDTLTVVNLAGFSTITGGAGNLSLAANLQNPNTISGSSAGWTFIDNTGITGNQVLGGSGTASLPVLPGSQGGENTFIKAGTKDRITVGSGLTYIDAKAGGVSIIGGSGKAAGVIEGHGVNQGELVANTVIVGADGASIIGGSAPMFIDARGSGLGETIQGGAGAMEIYGGNGDVIRGQTAAGGGSITVHELTFSGGESVTGGSAALTVFNFGNGNTILGGTGTNWIDSGRNGGNSSIVGGNGSVTGAVDPNGVTTVASANTVVISDVGDTITGGSGTISIQGGAGGATINAGTAAPTGPGKLGTTVEGGNKDVINNAGPGTLLVDITAKNSGAETVNLGTSHGATTLRDVSGGSGTGALANTTVIGFSTAADTVASASSVAGTTFTGTSAVLDGNLVLTFQDGSTMTFIGFASTAGFKFTT